MVMMYTRAIFIYIYRNIYAAAALLDISPRRKLGKSRRRGRKDNIKAANKTDKERKKRFKT
jgi:hypothetical protein